MSGTQTGRIEISRPQSAVWQQITTLADIPTWYDEWDNCQHPPEQTTLEEGHQFRLEAGSPPRRRVAVCHVVTVVEPTVVRWIETRRLHRPVLVEFRLEGLSANVTAVIHSKTVGTPHKRTRRSRNSDHNP